MKQLVVEANLRWRSPEEGGRQLPPHGPMYSTVARFERLKESWSKEAWSLVVEFMEQPDASLSHRVRVRFLADGPRDLLQPGSRFELMEGHQSVAEGIIAPQLSA